MKYIRVVLFIAITTGLSSSLGLLGGIGLEAVVDKLLPLVPLIIALPALNDLVGDYASIIAAHASDPAERRTTKRTLAKAISKVVWINIIGIVALSMLLANQHGYLLTGSFVTKFIIFVSFSIILIVATLFGITSLLDRVLERRRLNPDDILIPIVTTVTDVMMLTLIALAAWFLF